MKIELGLDPSKFILGLNGLGLNGLKFGLGHDPLNLRITMHSLASIPTVKN